MRALTIEPMRLPEFERRLGALPERQEVACTDGEVHVEFTVLHGHYAKLIRALTKSGVVITTDQWEDYWSLVGAMDD